MAPSDDSSPDVTPQPDESQPSASRPRQFSTTSAAPDQRLRAWEQYNENELFGLKASTLAPEGLLAAEANLQVGRVHLTEIRGNTHVIERTKRNISDKPVDSFMMCLLLTGDAFIYHSQGFDQIRAGDAVLYDSDSPFLYGFNGSNHQVILEVPRSLFQGRIAEHGVPVPRVLRLADNAGTAQWATTSAHLILDAMRNPDQTSAGVEEKLLSLQQYLVDPAAAGSTGYVIAAQEFIGAHLGDHSLSVDRIAAAVGLSERHLRRVFADAGITVASYITDERMAKALTMLRDPKHAHRSVADIAHAVGYLSASHFSRTFRAHTGSTPSDVRG